jgi:NitT/TauT family transport system substrate-binding protein
VHNVVLGFTQTQGVKARPVQTGGLPATLTQVLSGQIDIGWATRFKFLDKPLSQDQINKLIQILPPG